MKKQFLVFLSILTLGLVGCSNQNSQNDQSESSKQVIAAVENASRPLSYTDDSGELTGYEIDILNAINEVIEDYEIIIEGVDAEAAQVGLDTGKYQLIGGGLYRTDEREELYIFPEDYTGVSKVEIYKRSKDKSIQNLSDLVGLKVHPVTANGGIFNLLTKYNEENPEAQITIQQGESGDYAERFKALNDGISDAVVMPSNLGADEIIDQLGLEVTTADKPVQVNPTYFLIGKDQSEFAEKFNAAVSELKSNGKLEEISQEWYKENIFDYEISQ